MQNQTIQSEAIEQTLQLMSEFTPQKIAEEQKIFQAEQPNLIAFILAMIDDLEQVDKEIILYVVHTVWQTFRRLTSAKLPTISIPKLKKALDTHQKLLKNLEEYPEEERHELFMKELEKSQPDLMFYVAEALTEEDEEGYTLSETAIGTGFLALTILVAVLDAERRQLLQCP